MKVIDFHTHVFSPEQIAGREALVKRDAWFAKLYGNPKAKMATAEDLVGSMEKRSIAQSVVFGFPWVDGGLLREANDYVFEAAAEHGEKLAAFVTVNPSDRRGTEEELTKSRKARVRGIGELMPDGNGWRLGDIEMMRAVSEFAIEKKLPVLTHVSEPYGHAYAGKGKTHGGEVLALAEAFPEMVIVCAHWGGGLFFYELQSEVAKTLTNVYYDTSASCFIYGNKIYEVAAAIAPGKVLFGSDYPTCPVERQMRAIREAGIGEEVKAGMMGGNAERLLSGQCKM